MCRKMCAFVDKTNNDSKTDFDPYFPRFATVQFEIIHKKTQIRIHSDFLLLSTIFDHFCSHSYWLRCSSAELNFVIDTQKRSEKDNWSGLLLCVASFFLSISYEVYEKLTFVIAFRIHSFGVFFLFPFHPFLLMPTQPSILFLVPFFWKSIVHTSIHTQSIGLVHW